MWYVSARIVLLAAVLAVQALFVYQRKSTNHHSYKPTMCVCVCVFVVFCCEWLRPKLSKPWSYTDYPYGNCDGNYFLFLVPAAVDNDHVLAGVCMLFFLYMYYVLSTCVCVLCRRATRGNFVVIVVCCACVFRVLVKFWGRRDTVFSLSSCKNLTSARWRASEVGDPDPNGCAVTGTYYHMLIPAIVPIEAIPAVLKNQEQRNKRPHVSSTNRIEPPPTSLPLLPWNARCLMP